MSILYERRSLVMSKKDRALPVALSLWPRVDLNLVRYKWRKVVDKLKHNFTCATNTPSWGDIYNFCDLLKPVKIY